MTRGLFIIMLFFLIVCKSCAANTLAAYINLIKARPAAEPEPIRLTPKLRSFRYIKEDRGVNPFRSGRERDGRANGEENSDVLEQFPIDSLSLVGVFKKGSTSWALLSHLNREIFSIKIGGYLGQHRGRVIQIGEDFLQWEEPSQVDGRQVKILKMEKKTE